MLARISYALEQGFLVRGRRSRLLVRGNHRTYRQIPLVYYGLSGSMRTLQLILHGRLVTAIICCEAKENKNIARTVD